MEITVKAAAKLNLLLDLTSILANGYHSIYTVMQSIDIFDTITVSDTNSNEIQITCSDKSIPTDSKNTVYKAAALFFDRINKPCPGIKIHIDKVIPSQAGMAGGSSDAAAVLKALNLLYEAGLSDAELCSLGEKIGADIPFCLMGGTRLCLNKGEIMAELPPLPECYFVVVKPKQGVSTKFAYESFDSAEWIRHPDNDGFLFAATQRDLKTMCEKAANVFEQVIEIKERVIIKHIMRKYNVSLAMMTGSGAAVFGIYEKKEDADKCIIEMKKAFDKVYMAKPTEKGIFVV